MKDIKEIARKYRDENKNGDEKITTKELLWFVISKFDGLETRVTKTETTQKLFMWSLPIFIAIAAIIGNLV